MKYSDYYSAGNSIGNALANMFASFFEELNRIIYENNQMKAEATAWAGLVGEIKKKTQEMEDLQKRAPEDLISQADIDGFKNDVEAILKSRNPQIPEEEKATILKNVEEIMLSYENFSNEQDFEKELDKIKGMTEAERELTKQTLRELLQECEQERNNFGVYQVIVNTDPIESKAIANKVQNELEKRNILCHGVYDVNNVGKSYLVCYNREDQWLAKTLTEMEICHRGMTFTSMESVMMAAKVMKQECLRYNGFSAGEISVIEKELFAKGIPAYTEPMEDGTYSLGGLSKDQKLYEKAIAKAMIQANGLSKNSGYNDILNERAAQVQKAHDFACGLGEMESSSSGILFDANSTKESPHYLVIENGRIREFRGKPERDSNGMIDSSKPYKITECQVITRDENPTLYENRLEIMMKNFSFSSYFLSDFELKDTYGIDTSNVKNLNINDKLKTAMDKFYGKRDYEENMESGLETKAELEREIILYAIDTSRRNDAGMILKDVEKNIGRYTATFFSSEEGKELRNDMIRRGHNEQLIDSLINDLKTNEKSEFTKMVINDCKEIGNGIDRHVPSSRHHS